MTVPFQFIDATVKLRGHAGSVTFGLENNPAPASVDDIGKVVGIAVQRAYDALREQPPRAEPPAPTEPPAPEVAADDTSKRIGAGRRGRR